jgi:hypothetical protein
MCAFAEHNDPENQPQPKEFTQDYDTYSTLSQFVWGLPKYLRNILYKSIEPSRDKSFTEKTRGNTQLSFSTGFITNSSAYICGYPVQLLHHPDVQTFLKTYEIDQGYDSDTYARGYLERIIIDLKEKKEFSNQLDPITFHKRIFYKILRHLPFFIRNQFPSEYERPKFKIKPLAKSHFFVVYGDENYTLTTLFVELLDKIQRDTKIIYPTDLKNPKQLEGKTFKLETH